MDHLDFIRIRGLQSSETEVFQGAAGGGSVDGETVTTQSDWTAIPDEAIEMLNTYSTELVSWMEQINAQSRALNAKSRDTTAIAPYVPNILSTVAAGGAIVATGGAALPAVATVMGAQVVSNLVASSVQQYQATMDPNSPSNILKKALLYEEAGDEFKSILKKALLYELSDEQESVLKDYLEALQYNDEQIDFGQFSVWLRSKVLG